ncbi:MAG: hypothetical protein Q9160_003120 [Pyrenula sp. 1 TL-2023]
MMNRLATLCAALITVVYAAPQAPGTTVQINPRQKYQSFDGIGVSEAFQRSLVLHELDTPSQNLALDYLFSRTKGAGFTILRNGLGSSPDDPFDLMKSIAPVAPRSNSSQLTDSVGTDFNGGYLCGVTNTSCATGDWRQAYADKLVRYIRDYEANGIPISYLGFLNEPDLNTSYASMQSSGQQAADFLEVLYPTLQESGLKTQIACCDGSGWEQNRERLTGIQQAGAEGTLGLVTSHGYSSAPGAPFATDKKVWQTEWSTFDPINYNWYASGSQSEGLTWANHIQQAFAVSNVSGFLYWWGAANTTDNQSLLFVNGTNEVSVTKRLWAHAHFGARFIRPGAMRIAASISGGNSTGSALNVTAFSNTDDGSVAVQVINNGDAAQTVSLGGIGKLSGKGCVVQTWLTNQSHNLTQACAAIQGGRATAQVPGRSLISFIA